MVDIFVESIILPTVLRNSPYWYTFDQLLFSKTKTKVASIPVGTNKGPERQYSEEQ
jgi:hypothetical protein